MTLFRYWAGDFGCTLHFMFMVDESMIDRCDDDDCVWFCASLCVVAGRIVAIMKRREKRLQK